MGVEVLGTVVASAAKAPAQVAAGLARFGPEIKGVYLPKIVNEGPVAPKFLEQTLLVAKPVIPKAVALEPMTIPVPKIEPIVAPRVENAVLVQPALREKKVEKKVLEKVVEEKPKESLEEEEWVKKMVYLEDEEASFQRKLEIRLAVKRARKEADRMGFERITGALVARFLPSEHESVRSQVIKKTGPDGSYQETIEVIAGTGELGSEEEATKRFEAVVDEKKPVKLGKDGKVVEPEAVARVYKYHLFKPAPVT